MGATFWDDYKHGWRVSRRRLRAMAADVGLEVIGTRYTIGWITLRGGPAWAACRVVARALNATLNIPPVARFLEAVGLDELSAKVRKTILELVAVEMVKPGGGGRGA